MKTRVLMTALAVLLAITLVVTACSSPTATPVPTATKAPTQAPGTSAPTSTPIPAATQPPAATPTIATDTLVIGNASILSGPGTGFGIPQSRGVEKGVEIVNAAGGIKTAGKTYMVKLNTIDWGYTADLGRTGAEKLLNQGVKIIIGCGTATTVGAQQVTEPNKVLIFGGSTADAPFTKQFPYSFRIFMGPADGKIPTITYAHDKNPQNRKLFATYWNDASGKLAFSGLETQLKAVGWDSVTIQPYEPGTTDFAPFITGYLIPSGANFLYMISRTGEAGLLMKTAGQYGFKGTIVWCDAAGGLPEFKTAGQSANGAYLTQDWDWTGAFLGDQAKAAAVSYKAQYNDTPTMLYLNAIDAVTMIKAAVEKSGSTDTTAIRDAIPTIEWPSVWGGTMKMSAIGDRPGATVMHTMPIAKFDASTGTFVNVAQAIPPNKWKE